MARKKTSSRTQSGRGGGSTLFGVLAGVILGLLAAAGVALYISGAPLPFVDRASRGPDTLSGAGSLQSLPDPNRGLSAAGIAPPPSVIVPPTAVAPAPGTASVPGGMRGPGSSGGSSIVTPGTQAPTTSGTPAPGQGSSDALGAFVAGLGGAPAGGQAAASGATAPRPAPIPTAPAGRYILQVGAFRVIEDAEALKARLALLGFEARITQAMVNGVLLNRVQVGPYATVDAMNQARERLTANRVESTVVRN